MQFKTPASLLSAPLLSMFGTAIFAASLVPMPASAATPNFKSAQHATHKRYGALLRQNRHANSSLLGKRIQKRLDQNDQVKKLFAFGERLGGSVALHKDLQHELIRELKSAEKDLKSGNPVLGGKRNLQQIYRGLVKVGLNSVARRAEATERVEKSFDALHAKRSAKTNRKRVDHLLYAIDAQLLTASGQRALFKGLNDGLRIVNVEDRANRALKNSKRR